MIMLLTALPPPPPMPHTSDAGLQFPKFGRFEIDRHRQTFRLIFMRLGVGCRPRSASPTRASLSFLEILKNCLSTIVRPERCNHWSRSRAPRDRGAARNIRAPRLADRRAGRPPRRMPGCGPDSGRPSMPTGRPTRTCPPRMRRTASGRPVSRQAPPVSTTRRPAWAEKPDAASRSRRNSSDLLDARTNDAHEMRFRRMRRMLAAVADLIERDRLAIVRRRGDRRAIERLQPFGVAQPAVEAAGDIHGDVIAAERHRIDMRERAAGEDGERGAPAPMSMTMAPSSASSSSSTERPAT